MSVISDILNGYLRPRSTVRRRLGTTVNEGQAFGYLVTACLLLFVAQLPEVVRSHVLSRSDLPLAGIAAGRLIGIAVFAPILFYCVAGLTAAGMRIFSLPITWHHSRVSLFWALLATVPAAACLGLLRGLMDWQPALLGASVTVGLIFLFFWIIGLIEALAAKVI